MLVLICLTILVKWVSLYPDWIESNYTYGFYPLISKVQRILLGWIPFSVGDLFYGFLVILIVFRVYKFSKLLFKKQLTRNYFKLALQQGIFIFLFVYVSFNLLWGLNYNRKGVADQLALNLKPYTDPDLDTLCITLQEKLNFYAVKIDTLYRDDYYKKERHVFNEASATYLAAEKKYPFFVLSYPIN